MIDETKKPAPDFVVRLVGHGIRPWTIPMRTLALLLYATQRLVEFTDEDENDTGTDADFKSESLSATEFGFLRLVGLRSQSAGYAISARTGKSAVDLIRTTGLAIKNPDKFDWPESTISSIRNLSDAARAVGCQIEYRLPGRDGRLGAVIAKISPNTFCEVSDAAFVHGETSISGRIERVGGAGEPRCALRIPGQIRMIFCEVDGYKLAENMAKFLYQDITLNGRATWLRHNWQVKYFRVSSFDEPKKGSIREALKRVREAGGKAWDSVADPAAEIAEMRRA